MIFPSQRNSWSKKLEKEWYQACTDYIITTAVSSNNKSEIQTYYNAVLGIIDQSTYSYVLNPYNSVDPKLKSFPAVLRNYDIITPILERFIGEYIKQYSDYIVKVHDAEFIIRRDSTINSKLDKIISDLFISAIKNYQAQIKQQGYADSPEEIPIPNFEEIKEKYLKEYNENRAMESQDILDYVIDFTESEWKYIQGFFDWFVAGQVFSYRDARNSSLYKEIVSPLEYYPITNGEQFVENHNKGCRIYTGTINYILDNFRDIIEDEDIDYINTYMTNQSSNSSIAVDLQIVKSRKYGDYYSTFYDGIGGGVTMFELCGTDRMFDINHCVWTTQIKVGILLRQDNLGQVEEVEVQEGYKLDKSVGDISIEWDYYNQVIETYRFGNEHTGIYTKPRPVICQRSEFNNSNPKLPYNGIIGMFKNGGNSSHVRRILPYQALYNIYTYQQEKTIGKFKGQIVVLPDSLLADSELHSQADRIYYMNADGTLYLNDEDINASSLQAIKVLDMRIADYIDAMNALRKDIKIGAWETVNMNDQRYGNIDDRSGKAVTEQAIFRVSIGSTPMFETFNKFKEKDYEADLDWSKIAFIEGRVASYKKQDGSIGYLELDSSKHIGTLYGVFAKNNAIEQDKIKAAKELAFSMAQNGQADIAIEVLDMNSYHQIKSFVRRATELQRQFEQNMSDKTNATKVQVEQMVTEREDKALQNEMDIAILKETGSTEREFIKRDVQISLQPSVSENSTVSKSDAEISKLNLKSRELAFKEMESRRKEILERDKIKSNEKIAKMNKNKYDKRK